MRHTAPVFLSFASLLVISCGSGGDQDYWDPAILDAEPTVAGRYGGCPEDAPEELLRCVRDGDFTRYSCNGSKLVKSSCGAGNVCWGERDKSKRRDAECVTKSELMHDIEDGVEPGSDFWRELVKEKQEMELEAESDME